MLKRFFLILIFFIPWSLFAQSIFDGFSFSADAKFGLSNGHFNEEVFLDVDDKDQRISFLLWNIQNLPFYKFDFDISLSNYFAMCNCYFSSKNNHGKIKDYDWYNWNSSKTNELTHYSEHNNKIDNFYNIDAILGIKNNFSETFECSFFLDYSYVYFSINAIDGFKQYSSQSSTAANGEKIYFPWNSELPKTDLYGKAVNYQGQIHSFGLGITFDFVLLKNFNLSFTTAFKPDLSNTTLDNHILRKVSFLSEYSSSTTFDFLFNIEKKINKNNILTMEGSIKYSKASQSTSYQIQSNFGTELANPFRSSFFIWNFCLGYKYLYEK